MKSSMLRFSLILCVMIALALSVFLLIANRKKRVSILWDDILSSPQQINFDTLKARAISMDSSWTAYFSPVQDHLALLELLTRDFERLQLAYDSLENGDRESARALLENVASNEKDNNPYACSARYVLEYFFRTKITAQIAAIKDALSRNDPEKIRDSRFLGSLFYDPELETESRALLLSSGVMTETEFKNWISNRLHWKSQLITGPCIGDPVILSIAADNLRVVLERYPESIARDKAEKLLTKIEAAKTLQETRIHEYFERTRK